MTPEHAAELLELTHAVCEGEASAAEIARLEQLLRGDREAQRLYLRHVHLHGTLRWDLGAAAELSAVRQLCPPQEPAAPPRAALPWGRLLPRVALAAAVLLAVGLALWWGGADGPVDVADGPFAVLAEVVDVEWDTPGPSPVQGAPLAAGRLSLKAGLARIDFVGGASLTLEGPAELTLAAPDRAVLRRGQLTARVPGEVGAFHVETPGLGSIDGGAAFGVLAGESGETEVCAFEGPVRLAMPAPHLSFRRLAEGTGVRLTPGGRRVEIRQADLDRYQRTWCVSYGVIAAAGAVRFVEPARHRRPSHYPDNEHLVVFPERAEVLLAAPLEVTIDQPGRHHGPFEARSARAPAGTRVRTFVVQLKPRMRHQGVLRRAAGSITFDQPVLAVIATSALLRATDPLLGSEQSPFLGRGGRGIEDGDTVEISPDRYTLSVDLSAGAGIDQVRVLVAAPPRFLAGGPHRGD